MCVGQRQLWEAVLSYCVSSWNLTQDVKAWQQVPLLLQVSYWVNFGFYQMGSHFIPDYHGTFYIGQADLELIVNPTAVFQMLGLQV